MYHYVGGTLTGDNVWENDLPYLVYENIVLNDGATLTIRPGAKIYFDDFLGIYVNGGNLFIGGELDTVVMQSFSNINWSGIHIKSRNNQSPIIIDNVRFLKVENAISVDNSSYIFISSCYFDGVYLEGVTINNSNNCVVENCYFNNTYRALNIIADDGLCFGNIIRKNQFVRGQIGLMIVSKNRGESFNNIIENNFFGGALTSMYFDNSTLNTNRRNYVRGNVITATTKLQVPSTSSTGIYSAMDSVFIENNIFWNNETAISFKSIRPIFVDENTFYENTYCIKDLTIAYNQFTNNTFCNNKENIATFSKSSYSTFQNNNFLQSRAGKFLFINDITDSVSISYNYWETNNDSIINSFIYDCEDDSLAGKIIYKPILENYVSQAPVSPPIQVTKQLVDNGVLLKWKNNRESDLAGYNMYYSNFENYSFGQTFKALHDTVFFIPGADINDAFAVTSYDTDYSEINGQNKGHESAYSFASIMPYAGNDDSICESVAYYEINNATIPFSFSGLSWRTNGTGSFSDSTIINPKYYPSENDYETGIITFILSVQLSDYQQQDSFSLKLIKTPESYAGEDKIYTYNEEIKINDASASYYQSVEWNTLGDGWFDDAYSLNPFYYYGRQDSINGSVNLVLHAISTCGNISDTVNYNFIYSFCLEGKVNYADLPVNNAQVIALSLNDSNFESFYRVKTDEDGSFSFKNLIENDYVLFAIPDTLDYQGAPTYYAKTFSWNQAHIIKVNGNVHDVDIELSKSINDFVQGSGTIKGSFDFPESYFQDSIHYCQDWFDRDTSLIYCSEGLSNIVVGLFNSTKTVLIDYALTDYKGDFCFKNLPFGSYYIYSDIPRYQTNAPTELTLTPDNQVIDDIHFYIDNNHIYIRDFVKNSSSNQSISVFPNPCNDDLKVSGIFDNNLYYIDIHDFTGQLAYHETKQLHESSFFSIPTSKLPNGLYFIKIYSSDNVLYTNDLIIAH